MNSQLDLEAACNFFSNLNTKKGIRNESFRTPFLVYIRELISFRKYISAFNLITSCNMISFRKFSAESGYFLRVLLPGK